MSNGKDIKTALVMEGGAAFVIRPPEPLGIGRTEKNADELERIYQIGRREAIRRFPYLKNFLINS